MSRRHLIAITRKTSSPCPLNALGRGRGEGSKKKEVIFPAILSAIPLILVLGIGCGGPGNIGQVKGKVTLGGQPLPGAIIQFKPKAGGSPSTGIADDSGNYKLGYTRTSEGAEIGEHSVSITTFSSGDPDAEPPKPRVPEKVPGKYNAKSELTATVKAGLNTIDFPLESAGEIVQPR